MLITLTNILLLFALAYTVWLKESSVLKPLFWPALILRMCGGLFIGVLYNGYYTTGDTWTYFSHGSAIAALAGESWPGYFGFLGTGYHPSLTALADIPPRAMLFTKIASLVILLSGYNYWIASCWFSLVSFLSSWFLVKQIEVVQARWRGAAAFAFLFVPSIVCWSAGLIKESLAMAALCFVVAVFLRFWSERKIGITHWLLLFPALAILWGLKYYYLAVLLPVLVTEVIMQRIIRPRLPGLKRYNGIALWLVFFLVPVAIISVSHPNFYPHRFFEVIVTNYEAFLAISEADDVVRYPGLTPEAWSIASHSPRALLAGLFRPFIWEATSPVKLLAALENTALAVLFIGAITGLRQNRFANSSWVLPLVMYCLLLAVFLALSTPNLGTLSRYRVGFLPFFVLLIAGNNPILSWLSRAGERSDKHLVR